MNLKIILLLLLLNLFNIGLPAQNHKGLSKSRKTVTKPSDMRKVVEKFYEIRERALDERGSKEDVVKLFDLTADNVIYEHPQANVKMTREQAFDGIMAHLNEGKNAHFTLRNIKVGTNFVLVEMVLEYQLPDKNGNFVKTLHRDIELFEFVKGKIQRIAYY